MQNEKIAAIALIIIIAGAISVYFLATSGDDFLSNLFPSTNEPTEVIKEDEIQLGDCVDLQYIGRYGSNDTIFDTSYEDTDNLIEGDPLRVFVTLDQNEYPPSEYIANYSSAIIPGLMEELTGLKLGETYTIGPIDPAKAYGEKKLEVGSTFNTATFAINTINQDLSLNQTLKVTKLTDTIIDLEWVNIDESSAFTMPQIILGNLSSTVQEDMITIPPPYFIWEDTAEIESINDETVTVKVTPNKLSNMFESVEQIQYGFGANDIFIGFSDATTAVYDDTTITLTSNPTEGSIYTYEYEYFGQVIIMNYTVGPVTNDTINISATYEGTEETQYMLINKTLSFNRTYEMKKFYSSIPMVYAESLIGLDIEREGYSLHELAGEELIFEVYVENIYKTSQKES